MLAAAGNVELAASLYFDGSPGAVSDASDGEGAIFQIDDLEAPSIEEASVRQNVPQHGRAGRGRRRRGRGSACEWDGEGLDPLDLFAETDETLLIDSSRTAGGRRRRNSRRAGDSSDGEELPSGGRAKGKGKAKAAAAAAAGVQSSSATSDAIPVPVRVLAALVPTTVGAPHTRPACVRRQAGGARRRRCRAAGAGRRACHERGALPARESSRWGAARSPTGATAASNRAAECSRTPAGARPRLRRRRAGRRGAGRRRPPCSARASCAALGCAPLASRRGAAPSTPRRRRDAAAAQLARRLLHDASRNFP